MAAEPASDRVLLVEGPDDKHVVQHLCRTLTLSQEFRIADKEGFSNLRKAITPEIKRAGQCTVGIIVDANDDLQGRWQAISNELGRVGIPSPRSPSPSGTVIEGTPRIGIWLMPDNNAQGELEDFVERLIPDADPVWPRSRQYVDDIPQSDRKFKPEKTLKAKLHAWLATRADPRKMGSAIGAGDLNTGAPLAKALVDWLRLLFR